MNSPAVRDRSGRCDDVCPHRGLKVLLAGAMIALAVHDSHAGDWPQYRHGAERGAVSAEAIPADLHLHWTRQLPEPQPAWPDVAGQVQFDDVWQPVVAAGKLFLGSNVDDRVIAYDTRTGEELWSFHTDGPVRFAPAVWKDRVFAASDDGFLYCLAAKDGELLWKFRGGPMERRIIGNHRLVSSWPARGGAVVADGTVYFAAGIWPSMGIFIHAVDAESGEVKWTNDTTGSRFVRHPHGADAFGSICPQGYLAVAGEHLIVPGGRTMPAIFDRETGELVRFDFGRGGSGPVMAAKDFYITRGMLRDPMTGDGLGLDDVVLLSDEFLVTPGHSRSPILASSARGRIEEETYTDRRGKKRKRLAFRTEKAWEIPGSNGDDPLAMAGHLVIAERGNRIRVWNAKPGKDAKPEPVWEHKFDSPVRTAIAADDRLFVMTDDSRLHCFAAGETQSTTHPLVRADSSVPSDEWPKRTAAILERTGAREGYAVVAGIGTGRLIDELLDQSKMHIVVLDPDERAIARLRERMVRSGHYGKRIVAHVGTFESSHLPPYFANLIVGESFPFDTRLPSTVALARLYETLRPYGGAACLWLSDDEHAALAKVVAEAKLAKAEIERAGNWTLIRRVGSLPGAGEWTHQYGNSANTIVSKDDLVKAPLGVLWFGGPANEGILPRHGHGPSPQVAGGRLVIEGPDKLRAVDVYTGRVLWEKKLPGIGEYYDTTRHFAGAGEIGSNYVTLPDHVYVVHGRSLLELDAATGDTTQEFHVAEEAGDHRPYWGFLAAHDDLLVATTAPMDPAAKKREGDSEPPRYASTSRRLVVFDRHSGKLLWQRDAKLGFRHNAIVPAAGKVFCIDGLTPEKIAAYKRRGVSIDGQSKLFAFDARTGNEVWSTGEDVFGTFLSYSAAYDLLLQAGSANRDRAADEAEKGMIAYRGRDGHILWKNLELEYGGPCLLWRDKIITNGGSGTRIELLTGQFTDWKFRRMYGCNTVIGSEHLLTFRSGAAGFCDLTGDSGTGNLGGFRSSCTANLIVADGVLNAPDYTRTCTCAYQHQTSLAFVHMPEADLWTFSPNKALDSARIGVNLGAPGDRRAANGTLWFDYPVAGGPSPKVAIEVQPRNVRWFSRHASSIDEKNEQGIAWVAGSGGEGVTSISVGLPESAAEQGTIRLHFAEPENLAAGKRVFAIRVQDTPVLERFDIVAAAGAPRTAIVREFADIPLGERLKIELLPEQNSRPPVLCGIEIVPAQGERGGVSPPVDRSSE